MNKYFRSTAAAVALAVAATAPAIASPEKDGYKVSVAQPPETSLEDDVAATTRTMWRGYRE